MFSLQAVRLFTAFAAIIGVSGLSVLPAEHVHPDQHDGSGHHSAIVHQHVTTHHPHPGSTLLHRPAAAGGTLHAGDDHADAWQSPQAFVTAGKQLGPRHPLRLSHFLTHILSDPREARRTAVVPWTTPPQGPPFDAARLLRAPPFLAQLPRAR